MERLYKATAAALRDPKVAEQFANQGGIPIGSSPQDFASYLRSEMDKWARVIKEAGIKPVR